MKAKAPRACSKTAIASERERACPHIENARKGIENNCVFSLSFRLFLSLLIRKKKRKKQTSKNAYCAYIRGVIFTL